MDATWGIVMLVVGLTSSIVATVGEGILSTVLFAVRFLLLGVWCCSIVPAAVEWISHVNHRKERDS